MAKIAFLGDTHMDGKSSSVQFIEFQRKFFVEQFIPYLLANDIKIVIQFGDLFDRRTSINFRVLYHVKKMFFDLLQQHGIKLYLIVGNHDIFYLETLEINSPQLLLQEYDNIEIFTKPTTLTIDTVSFDLIPWICKGNYDDVHNFIKQSHSDYCIGHFEIAGFAMYRGHIAEEGISPSLFNRYRNVWSGHYHTRSSAGNISYIGTPMEITWQDCGDPRGFEVFDTDALQSEFVKNNYTLFEKIEYNDQIDATTFPYITLKEKYVKVIVTKKTNLAHYNNFLQRVYESGCHDVAVMENFEEYSNGTIEDTVVVENTMDVVNSYIDSIDISTDKEKLKSLMQRTYTEALNVTI